MALVPWTYNNPRVDRSKQKIVSFLFNEVTIEFLQNPDIEIDLTKNTECKVWDGSYLLAKYIEQSFCKNYWLNKRCLELGSGCGLVGVVAWLLGADVTLTDMPSALYHTQKCWDFIKNRLQTREKNLSEFNTEENKIYSTEDEISKDNSITSVNKRSQIKLKNYIHRENLNTTEPKHKKKKINVSYLNFEKLRLAPYTWGDLIENQISNMQYFQNLDYILCSDIIYDPNLTDNLIKSLTILTLPGQTKVLISYKRRGLGEDIFFNSLVVNGFKCILVERDCHPIDFFNSDYNLFILEK